MTPKNSKSFIRKAKDIGISSSLALIILGQAAAIQSCSNPQETEGDYEVSETYTQGVKTYIKEVKPGEFKITDEIAVPSDSSKAIVTYLDGRTEVLSKEKSKEIIDKEIQQNQAGVGTRSSLSNVLLYGGMGYFLGRTMSPGYMNFRPDMRRDGSGVAGAGRSQYYSNNETYQKSTNVQESINKSRTMTARPVGSKSGFFGRSSSGGFGG